MSLKNIDWSSRGRARVYALTVLGTLLCIAVAFIIDSYSLETGIWQLSDSWLNNLIIPLVLAPPFFYYLLAKLRELAIAHHELMNVAATDSLTACLNRRAFTAIVEGYLDRVAQKQVRAEGALLVIDVDHFKSVNDQYGHGRGDEALRMIADTIRETVREIDVVGRLGGEEFGVFLPGVTTELTSGIAERIRMAIHKTAFAPEGRPHPLSVSIGGAAFADETSFTELFRIADRHLYVAKNNGRDRVDIEHIPPPGPPASADQSMMLH